MRPFPPATQAIDTATVGLIGQILALFKAEGGLLDVRGRWWHKGPSLQNLLETLHTGQLRHLLARASTCVQSGKTDMVWVDTPAAVPQTGASCLQLTPLEGLGTGLCAVHLTRLNQGDPVESAEWSLLAMLRQQSLTDPLTGLYNRRWLTEQLVQRSSSDLIKDSPMLVLLLDLDHFKAVNDEHGHLVGDQVLQITSARLSALIRPSDQLCRYGGEEFLAFLPRTTPEKGEEIADRMRTHLAQSMDCLHERCITASIGISAVSPMEQAIEPALRRADEALYQAKAAGRNCVRMMMPADLPPIPQIEASTE